MEADDAMAALLAGYFSEEEDGGFLEPGSASPQGSWPNLAQSSDCGGRCRKAAATSGEAREGDDSHGGIADSQARDGDIGDSKSARWRHGAEAAMYSDDSDGELDAVDTLQCS